MRNNTTRGPVSRVSVSYPVNLLMVVCKPGILPAHPEMWARRQTNLSCAVKWGMRFQKGQGCAHPRRGRARHPYRMSEAARKQRLGNRRAWRSYSETQAILGLIEQEYLKPSPRSERIVARELGVSPSYVHKRKKRRTGVLSYRDRSYTLYDLAEARLMTSRMRAKHPELFASKHE